MASYEEVRRSFSWIEVIRYLDKNTLDVLTSHDGIAVKRVTKNAV